MTLIASGTEPIDVYHASGAWGSSLINAFITSPQVAHLKLKRKLPFEKTAAMVIGSAVHARFDGTFDQDYMAGPAVSSRRVKAWTEAVAKNPDKTLLTPKDIHIIDQMEASIRVNPYAACLLDNAEAEVGIRRGSPFGEYQIQSRMDIYKAGSHIADIKTTKNIDDFVSSITAYDYHRQAAFYRWLCIEETGHVLPFSFIVVEKSAPYRCRVIDIEDEFLLCGWEDVEQALRDIGTCYDSGNWDDPGYQLMKTPAWLKSKEIAYA